MRSTCGGNVRRSPRIHGRLANAGAMPRSSHRRGNMRTYARGIGAVGRGPVERILRALRDQPVCAARERVLDREAFVGETVGHTLMQPAYVVERMERHDERNPEMLLHA